MTTEYDNAVQDYICALPYLLKAIDDLVKCEGSGYYLLAEEQKIYNTIQPKITHVKAVFDSMADDQKKEKSLQFTEMINKWNEVSKRYNQDQEEFTALKNAMAKLECNRLAFLTEDEQEQLLNDPLKLNEFSSKLFSEDICLQTEGNRIYGIMDKKGEKLAFDSAIEVTSIPNAINKAVEYSRQAVHREISSALKTDGSIIELLNSSFINQAIEVVDLIRNTKDTEAALSEGLSGLKSYLQKLNCKLDSLSKEAHTTLSQRKKILLNALITLNVNHRNLIQDDMIPAIEDGAGLCDGLAIWRQSLRFYHEKDEGVKVKVDAYELQYGYNYLGVVQRLVVTRLTRQAYIHLGRAVFQGHGVTFEGPAGTGKTETAKDFYRHLGQHIVMCYSFEETTAQDLVRIIEKANRAGSFLIFDDFNRMDTEVVKQAWSSVEKMATKKQSGLTLTFNPDYAGRNKSQLEWYHIFSRFSMYRPDLLPIFQVMMHSEGLGLASDSLCKQLQSTIKSFRQKLSKQDPYDYGLRTTKSIILETGKMCRNGFHHGNALLTAICNQFESLLTRDDLVLCQEILKENFPDCKKIPNLNDDFNMRYAEHHPTASDYIRLKASQIYQKSIMRHTLMVLGKDFQIIEDVAKCLGASCTMLDYQDDAEDFFETVFRDELEKAANQKHWIVIREKANEFTWWPSMLERLNTVGDDNKYLALSNGEKVHVPEQCRVVIFSRDAKVMSPAWVSRCGTINMMD